MKKLIAPLLLLTPSLALAAGDSYLYSGVDLAITKVGDGFKSADGLLVMGLHAAMNRYNSLVLEVGVQDDENELEGMMLRGSLLYRRNLFDQGDYLPFLSTGISKVVIAQNDCGYQGTQFSWGAYYTYECSADYMTSFGGTIEAGLNIRARSNQFVTVKLSSYKGSNEARVDMLSFGGSF